MDATGNSLTQFPITLMDGSTTSLGDFAGQVVLVVNVASRCGFTPQYAGLERLYETYKDRGFAVIGFPSNQFLQELSSDEKVAEFCSTNYGVTFPMSTRVKVNGKNAHPLFTALHEVADEDGDSGKVKWNFEKFLILPGGQIHRFRSKVEPEAPEVIDLIESHIQGVL
ncbi:glutathione peroxidase [Jonesiaceae bacterium BS-20]|uniref:Glutathione peroxidase n=1 Tax=Jonesiaceae bacterium BS-20 TaxID=3120821 RepID=A0AAU7DVK7_9MICO